MIDKGRIPCHRIMNERARRQAVQQPMSESVLGIDPLARFGALLILEPAVRIYDLDAMNDLAEVVLPRRRGLWRLRLGECHR
jgi:hypothetical protein